MLKYHNPIVVDGESIQVYETDFDNWHHFHAVTMGINAKTYEDLQRLVIERFRAPVDCEHPFPDPIYQAQYAYACGYSD